MTIDDRSTVRIGRTRRRVGAVFTAAAMAAVTFGVAGGAPVGAADHTSTFGFLGHGVDHTWVVPAGVHEATFTVVGANGGNGGENQTNQPWGLSGTGAKVTGTVPVEPGQTFRIAVGGGGESGHFKSDGGGAGLEGFGDGGRGNTGSVDGAMGGGGGAGSAVSRAGTALIVAGGGGGGGGAGWSGNGGAGGNGDGDGGAGGGQGAGVGGQGVVASGHAGTIGGGAATNSGGGGGGGGGGGWFGGVGGAGSTYLGAGNSTAGGGGGGAGGANHVAPGVFNASQGFGTPGTGPTGDGDDGHVTVTFTQTFDTATSVEVDPPTPIAGVGFVAGAQVVSPGGPGGSSGTVQFAVDGADVGAPVATDTSGYATTTIGALDGGAHEIGARFTPDDPGDFAPSEATEDFMVAPMPTALLVASTLNPSVSGETVTFSASVSPVGGSAFTPSGTIDFTVDGTPTASGVPLDATGQADFTTGSLDVGSHTVVATYSGDANFEGAVSDLFPQQVNQADSAVALSTSENPTVTGETVTFTAEVTAASGSVGTPTGSVQFNVDGTPSGGSVPLDGSARATYSTDGLSTGLHAVTATYSGNASLAGSTSAPLNQTVNKGDTRTTVSVPTEGGSLGDPVTITASVAPVTPAAGTPSGTVTFSVDGAEIGEASVDPDGSASLTATGLGVGHHTVAAAYSGDDGFNPSASSDEGTDIGPGSVTVEVVEPDAPAVAGQMITITALLAPVEPAEGEPTGTARFFAGATPLGDAVPIRDGQATLNIATLPVGFTPVHAEYSGDGDFNGAASAPVRFVVEPGSTVLALTSSATSTTPGDTIEFVATVGVESPAGATPTGSVVFSVNGVPLGGAVTVAADGTASLSTDALPEGLSTVSAVYSGDTNLDPANSNQLTIRVAAGAGDVGDTGSGAPDGSRAARGTAQGTLPRTGSPLSQVLLLGLSLALVGWVLQRRTRHAG